MGFQPWGNWSPKRALCASKKPIWETFLLESLILATTSNNILSIALNIPDVDHLATSHVPDPITMEFLFQADPLHLYSTLRHHGACKSYLPMKRDRN